MQIDVFTFIAQIINFVVLLILLRAFLYKPVLNAMNEREEKIASRLHETEKKQEQAEQEAQTYKQKRSEIDQERDDILAQARQDADARRDDLLTNVREEVEQERQRWKQAIHDEEERFLRDLQQRAEEGIVTAMRKALSELADARLESQIVQVFTQRLRDNDEKVIAAFQGAQTDIVVYSSFELSDDVRQQVTRILDEYRQYDPKVRFELDRSLVCGVAIQTSDYRLGWNLKNYLDSLEDHLRKTLDDAVQRDAPEKEIA